MIIIYYYFVKGFMRNSETRNAKQEFVWERRCFSLTRDLLKNKSPNSSPFSITLNFFFNVRVAIYAYYMYMLHVAFTKVALHFSKITVPIFSLYN